MVFIFPARDLILGLHHNLERLREERTSPLVVAEVTLESVRAIIDSMLHEAIATKSRWDTNNAHYLDVLLEKHFPGYSATCEDDASDWLYREVIDPIYLDVLHLVNQFIPERTWHIWHTRPFQMDFLVEQGVDFRIADWTRRFERGEIAIEDNDRMELVCAGPTPMFETQPRNDEDMVILTCANAAPPMRMIDLRRRRTV